MSATPLDYLHSAGARADPVVPLTWGVLLISIAVIVIISALVVGAIRRRPTIKRQAGEKIPLETASDATSWIWIGVSLSTAVLLVSVVWTMAVLAQVTRPATEPALSIEVTGHQWWWQVRYLSDDPAQVFDTANEIHIPAGRPVRVRLIGADVIHSFWVPALSGKTDLIPGQTNETWLEAHSPGAYRGQCTEYCGLEHAKMGFLVIADTPSDFEAWRRHQLQSPQPPTSGAEQAGEAQFVAHCGACHAVRGTDAAGMLGPDLSHLMQRRTLAAGILPNDPADLARWMSDPQGVKPGNLMQKPELAANEASDIQSYLKTLR
ncbi:MAG TPA: cytochrome c oxidase subunit II [Rhizomicrobium sp.]|nr:cytochrome c oxidase subunit II [Rhizomicrobium sp.]